jgi:hypothetical protein
MLFRRRKKLVRSWIVGGEIYIKKALPEGKAALIKYHYH